MCQVLNMSEFWTVVNCCKYDRVLNICQDAITTFHRVLNKPPVLNMPGLRIWQGCEYEYVRITLRAEYAWISLDMPL